MVASRKGGAGYDRASPAIELLTPKIDEPPGSRPGGAHGEGEVAGGAAPRPMQTATLPRQSRRGVSDGCEATPRTRFHPTR
jgi:hypothetical protein